ncbi:MAG: maleylpyruvate isomerase family mycothiol-dependent enzyme [Actinomycetota bacterium]
MAEPFVPLTNDQRSALLGLLTSLAAEDWARPTACRGWPVHDVVAHLVEVELLFGRVYRGELNGITREDADQQAGVDRWAQADGETLRFSLWHHGSATQRVIDSRSDESWSRDVTIFERPAQLRDVLGRHLFDLALHSLDVSAALGTPTLWGDRVRSIVEWSVRGAPDSLAARTTSGSSLPDAVRVDVEGAGAWTIENRAGSWQLGGSGASLAWITDPETLVLATTGRLEPAAAIERSKVEGDPASLAELIAAWQVKSG